MIFSVTPVGNFGNRLLAFMTAQAVAQRLGGTVRFNVELPEWGLRFDPALHRQLLASPALCRLTDADATSLDTLAGKIAASGASGVVFFGYFQRYVLLREVDFYRAILPRQPLDIEPFADDELVINIRAGDILAGRPAWYPLVPPYFYKTLIEQTGLRPVLLGQLDQSLYLQEVLRMCPGARLLPSAGAMVDFNRLRHAKNLCLTVSTFSWVAGWLSEAARIHYPLLGFMHPFCLPRGHEGGCGVDLTPQNDARYLYHLFPILNGAPELDYLRHVATLNPLSQPVSAIRAAALSLQAARPDVTMPGTVGGHSWYLRQYPAAAWSIAQGHYNGVREHYEQLGRFHGYELNGMSRHEGRRQRPNLALGKPALQSTVSEWSRQPDAAQDAAGAVSGEIDETYSFHTQTEDAPWWRVDLGTQNDITEIWLFNRIDQPELAFRAARLAVDIGDSEATYREAFRYESATAFGGADGNPLIIRFAQGVAGRFVRIRLLHRECLHLNQVEVYGSPV